MENKSLIEKEKLGLFSRIKKWFKNLFNTTPEEVKFENSNSENDLEFEKENLGSLSNIEEATPNYLEEKIQYEFSDEKVSRQKLSKIKLDLDNGKIGYEELYGLTEKEIDELNSMYDQKINEVVVNIRDVESKLDGYKNKIEKLQEKVLNQ